MQQQNGRNINMSVIYKLQLKDINGFQQVLLPEYSEIISTHEQNGIICIWYICSPENKLVKRTIHIYMTGQELAENLSTLKFIGTILNIDGFVFHVFEGDLP